MQKVRLIVSGRVQGVGFRYSTYALALEIGDSMLINASFCMY